MLGGVRRRAHLVVALSILCMTLFALFGIIGLMLADPLVAMIKVALERQSLRNAPNEG